MKHIVRETITLIRIERWLIITDGVDANEGMLASEHVVEEIVLNGSEAIDKAIRRILTDHQAEEGSAMD